MDTPESELSEENKDEDEDQDEDEMEMEPKEEVYTITEFDLSYSDRVKRLYRKCLPLIQPHHVNEWIKRDETIICFNNRHLISAMTYKVLSHNEVDYIDLLLLGVNYQYRAKGYGRRMMQKLMQIGKILTWADNNAVEFYEKLGFVKFWPGMHTQELLIYFTESTLMGFGFSCDDIRRLRLSKI